MKLEKINIICFIIVIAFIIFVLFQRCEINNLNTENTNIKKTNKQIRDKLAKQNNRIEELRKSRIQDEQDYKRLEDAITEGRKIIKRISDGNENDLRIIEQIRQTVQEIEDGINKEINNSFTPGL